MSPDSSSRLRLPSGGEGDSNGEELGGVGRQVEVPFVGIDRSGALVDDLT